MESFSLWIISLEFPRQIWSYIFTLATPQPVDMVFVIEESLHYTSSFFERTIIFMKKLLDHFSVSPGTTRVALITFNNAAKINFDFKRYQNREGLEKLYHKSRYDLFLLDIANQNRYLISLGSDINWRDGWVENILHPHIKWREYFFYFS